MEVVSVDIDAGLNGLEAQASGGGTTGSVGGDLAVAGACRIKKKKKKKESIQTT